MACNTMTDPKVVKRIISEIERGRVLSCMRAPVCTSLSVARDRTKVIRSKQYPWGIPDQELTEKERQSIQLGNACFWSCMRIIRSLDRCRVPYILENPDTSKAWFLPPVMQHLQKPWTKYVRADFCCFGTPWRKRTGFLVGHIPEEDLSRLAQLCHFSGVVCSRTGKAHTQLTGSLHGIPMTKWAEPYPKKLCNALAFALTAGQHASLAASWL